MSGSLGLASRTVKVVEYDGAWPALYAAEAARLEPFLMAHGIRLALEHTGSTSVPGLAAKPILDLLGGRHRSGDRAQCIAALEAAGYIFRGEQGIPGRDFFRRGDPRQYHLHLTTVGSGFWSDHLTFRDYLRSHPDTRDAYAALKRELAAKHPLDREAYIEGKTAFVRNILVRARDAVDAMPRKRRG